MLPSLPAATLTWDSSGSNPTSPVDGPGTWNTTTPLWSDGVTDVAWNNSNNDIAVFGGTNGSAGTITLDAGITANGLAFQAAGSGNYLISGNTLTLAGSTPTITAHVDAEISSVIAGTAGLVKTGTGRLLLSGANTYTGGTTISEGILAFTQGASIPGGFTLNGGTLQYVGSSSINSFTRNIMITAAGGTLDASGTSNVYLNFTGTLVNSGTGARTLTLTGTSTGDNRLDGAITDGAGGSTSLVKNGTGTWLLGSIVGNTHTYTGDTIIEQGRLRTSGLQANVLSTTSTFYIASAGILSLGNDQTIANLRDGSGGGGIIQQSYSNNTTRVATIESGSFSGQIRNSPDGTARLIGLAKTTDGTLRLSGDSNTYSGGTAISGGTLLVNNTAGSGLGVGAVTVSSSTLGGNGFIKLTGANSITVQSDGVIAAGDSLVSGGIGTLTLDGGTTTGAILNMQAGSSFSFDLSTGNTSDLIRFFNYAGASDFLRDSGGVTLNFSGAQAGTYELFSFYSNAGIALTAVGFNEADSLFNLGVGLSGYDAIWDYSTTGVIALTLTAIPEPSTYAAWMGGVGVLCAALRRKRRTKI